MSWLLLKLGDLVGWLGDILSAFFGGIGRLIDAVLNPVLAPLLAWLNPALTGIGDGVYAVLGALPAWAELTLLSAVLGALMLLAFRYTSNQAAIGRARDRITAHLLTLKLYKDDLGVALRAQLRLLRALGRLQWLMLRPILIMLLPMLLLLGQMGLRYQWRPLQTGEQAALRVRLAPEQAKLTTAVLAPTPGIAEAVGPVPGNGELVWRLKAGAPGRHRLQVDVGGQTIEKELVVGEPGARVSAERPPRHWTRQILHPAEAPLPTGGPVQSIEVQYGHVASYISGANWWIAFVLVVSMATALVLKPVFRVRF